MRSIICLAAALAFCGYSQAQAHPAHKADKAAFQINHTSWLLTDKDGTKVEESIDATGKFIARTAAGKHLDHGTAVMKGDKACFTSAMTKEGEVCWTTKSVAIGGAMDTVSSKGEKKHVTRAAYIPMSM